MSFTYDLTTDVGKARLLIGDGSPDEPLFTDEELAALISMVNDDPLMGAAVALERVAGDQALSARAVRILDLQVESGTTVAATLLKRADSIKALAAENEVLIDIAEPILNQTTYEQLLLKRVAGW
jgi:hypothetical protein